MNTITVTTNGPLECRGAIELVDAEGKPLAALSETRLCRCGHSANKPYCDDSHSQAGFTDSSAPPASAEVVGETGPLRLVVRPNGPLKLAGPCEVRHPVSGLIFAGRQTALCRCGQSNTKPFCDGTHRGVGFIAA